jgi:hypothetical protein
LGEGDRGEFARGELRGGFGGGEVADGAGRWECPWWARRRVGGAPAVGRWRVRRAGLDPFIEGFASDR